MAIMRRKAAERGGYGNALAFCLKKALQAPSPTLTYYQWQKKFEKLNEKSIADILLKINGMSNPPLISVLMPVYNPRPEFLQDAIDSVKAQLYPYWQLCIADDASTNPEIRKILAEEKDERIKVTFRKDNGNICAASNSALELCEGDYIALMDHDDKLPETALYYVAREIEKWPEAKIIYSDEDGIDEEGERIRPMFKGDWNEPLLLAQNYINHLTVYKADLLKKAGFRKGFEGSQDHDLLLRCSGNLNEEEIRHIPRILYHWRQFKKGNSFSESYETRCELSRRQAVRDYLEAKGLKAKVARGKAGFNRISFIPDKWPLVTCIVPARNHAGLSKRCLESLLLETDYPNLEIIFVDNGSDEAEAIALAREYENHDKVRVIHWNKPFNYSEINNMAAREAAGEILGLINNDISVIQSDWLKQLAGFAALPETGAVGPMLLYPNDTIQHAGVVRGIGGIAAHQACRESCETDLLYYRMHLCRWVMAVTGACLLVNKEKFFEVGGLDEQNLKVAFNDVDLCFKLHEKGYRNIYAGNVRLYHLESPSRKSDELPENIKRFEKETNYLKEKWYNELKYDPFYSPWFNRRYAVPFLLCGDEAPYFKEDYNCWRLNS